MRMENASIEFIQFDAKDVIATSTTGGPGGPLVYAFGSSLCDGEYFFSAQENKFFNVLHYEGAESLAQALNNAGGTDAYYAITRAAKGNNYEIEIDINDHHSTKDLPAEYIYSRLYDYSGICNWLTNYCQ